MENLAENSLPHFDPPLMPRARIIGHANFGCMTRDMKNIKTHSQPSTLNTSEELRALSPTALLQATRQLAKEERRITSFMLSHLEEIERRRLHLENHSSLFDFCRRELGYSESEANSRISAMRLSREVPEVIAKIEAGELSLTNLVKAQSYFRQEEGRYRGC